MVLILAGNSEIGAHVMSMISLIDLFKALDKIESSNKSDFFCMGAQHIHRIII